MKQCAKILVLTLAVFFWAADFQYVLGQGFYTEFGQNRLQHRDYSWQFYENDQNRIYFHTGGQDLARYAFYRSGKHLNELEQFFDYNQRERIELLLFNKLSDFRQNNHSLPEAENERNPGGRTQLKQNLDFVIFEGDYREFDKELRSALARSLLHEMLFGGDSRERVQNAALINIPNWQKEGIIRHAGREWDTRENEELKKMVRNGHLFSIHHLDQYQQAIAGQSFWKYLEMEYGEVVVSNILYMIGLNKNFEGGFNFVLGKSLSTLLNEWRQHVYETFSEPDDHQSPQKTTEDLGIEGKVGSFSMNPRKDLAAFITHDKGKQKLKIAELNSGDPRVVRSWNYKTDKLPRDFTSPVLEWDDDYQELLLFYEQQDRVFFTTYDPDEEEFGTTTPVGRLDKVLDFDMHPERQELVLSAVQGTRTNIFRFNQISRRVTPITNDIYTDLNPTYVRDGKYILFSSDRLQLNIEASPDDPSKAQYSDAFNIFFYDHETGNPELKQITKGNEADKIQPGEYDYPYFGYMTNENGAFNRNGAYLDSVFQHIKVVPFYEKEGQPDDPFADEEELYDAGDTLYFYTPDTSGVFVPNEVLENPELAHIDTSFIYKDYVEHYKLTDYQRSVKEHRIERPGRQVFELRYHDGGYGIFRESYPEEVSTKNIERNPVPALGDMSSMKQIQKDEGSADEDAPEEKDYFFITDFFDPEEYDEEDVIEIPEREWEQEGGDFAPDAFEIPSSLVYNTSFRPVSFTGQLDNSIVTSPYRPFDEDDNYVNDPSINSLLEVQLGDRLGHYSLTGGVGLSLDMSGADVFASFENKKNRLNRKYLYFRESESRQTGNFRSNITTQELRGRVTWPFSETRSIRGELFGRLENTEYLATSEEAMDRSSEQEIWSGLKGEYIFDNTRSLGKNLPWGTRAKGYFEIFGNITETGNSFSVLGGDFRHYVKISRNMIFAGRVAGATTVGADNLVFFMGGVENWVLPSFNDNISVDPDADYSFKTSATQMRGFEQNIRNGPSFGLVNAEIRWPVFQFFNDLRIRSDFLRNFQIVAFADAGTAWNGLHPYSDDNVVSRQIYDEDDSPIEVIVEPLREPMVWSYGGGIRTSFLGYFIKVDYGMGMELMENLDQNLHISMGLDF